MDSSKKIVEAYARYVKGLATISDVRCDGLQEIDLLAIDPARPERRFHIEVALSASPGLSKSKGKTLGPALRNAGRQRPLTRRALENVVKLRFDANPVNRKAREYGFERGNYQKVIVSSEYAPTAEAAAVKAGIELWRLQNILRELTEALVDERGRSAEAVLALIAGANRLLERAAKPAPTKMRISAAQLWNCKDPKMWDACDGELYDARLKPERRALERELEKSGLRARLARMSVGEFCDFLRDQYFPWIFAPGRNLVAARGALAKPVSPGAMDRLERARQRLVDRGYDRKAEAIAMLMGRHEGIPGMTLAASSGLLALVYPEEFATVHALLTKALQHCGALETPEAKTREISTAEAQAAIEVLRIKALELNRAFATYKWTTRRVGRAMWVAAH